jgi:sarcosine oxidase
MERYDVVVVGVGGMGSAALYHLARRGHRVLGLERFDIPHELGSSHGITRIIRLAYFEDPSYVPLLHRAYELWRELEIEAGEQLVHVTGTLEAGDRIYEGALRSCHVHDLPHEELDGREVARRYPAYRFPPDLPMLFQPDGGFVLPERCIVAHVQGAVAHGAVVRAREHVLGWDETQNGVRVETDRGTVEAERLVLTPGAWAQDVARLAPGLVVAQRQVLAWLQPSSPELFTPERFPVFNIKLAEATSTASRSSVSRASSSAATTTSTSAGIRTSSSAGSSPRTSRCSVASRRTTSPRGPGRRWRSRRASSSCHPTSTS